MLHQALYIGKDLSFANRLNEGENRFECRVVATVFDAIPLKSGCQCVFYQQENEEDTLRALQILQQNLNQNGTVIFVIGDTRLAAQWLRNGAQDVFPTDFDPAALLIRFSVFIRKSGATSESRPQGRNCDYLPPAPMETPVRHCIFIGRPAYSAPCFYSHCPCNPYRIAG